MKTKLKRLLSIALAFVLATAPIVNTFKKDAIVTAEATEDNGEKVAQFDMDNHVLMLRADGRVLGWGDNQYGQLGLGLGSEKKYDTPIEITFFKDKAKVKQLVCYEDASMALLEDGNIYACGKGDNGRLGLGSLVSKDTWTLIPNSDKLFVSQLYKGTACIYGVTMDDSLIAVGKNNKGQLGTGDKQDKLTFTKVLDHADIRQFEAGEDFAVIFQQDGDMLCAGNNSNNRCCNGAFDMSDDEWFYLNVSKGPTYNPTFNSQPVYYLYNWYFKNNPASTYATETADLGETYGAVGGSSNGMSNYYGTGSYLSYYNYEKALQSQIFKLMNPKLKEIIETNFMGSTKVPLTQEGKNVKMKVFYGSQIIPYKANYEYGEIVIYKTSGGCFEELWLPIKQSFILPTNNKFIVAPSDKLFLKENLLGFEVYIANSKTASTDTPTKKVSSLEICYPNANESYDIQYGNKHSILKKNGLYYSAGDNSQKQLLDNESTAAPKELKTLNDKISSLKLMEYNKFDVKVAGDANYFFASNPISNTLEAYGWGGNARGKLGIGSTKANTNELTPIPELKNKPVSTIVKGRNSVAFLLEDGNLMMCGDNLYGTLGLGDAYKNKAIVTSPVVNENIKFSFTAEPPLEPELPEQLPPTNVEAGKPYKVEWKPVKDASEYELSRTITTNGEEHTDTMMVDGLEVGTKVLGSKVQKDIVYKGKDTYYEDKINPGWDSVEYAVKALNFVGDSSGEVKFPTITITEPTAPEPEKPDSGGDGNTGTDTTPPTLNYIPNASTGQITFMASDDGSGVEGIYVNNNKQGVDNCTYYLTESVGVITAYAKDNAGNQSAPLLIKYSDIVPSGGNNNSGNNNGSSNSGTVDKEIDKILEKIKDNDKDNKDDIEKLERLIRDNNRSSNNSSNGLSTTDLMGLVTAMSTKTVTQPDGTVVTQSDPNQMATMMAMLSMMDKPQDTQQSAESPLNTALTAMILDKLDPPKKSDNETTDKLLLLFAENALNSQPQQKQSNIVFLILAVNAFLFLSFYFAKKEIVPYIKKAKAEKLKDEYNIHDTIREMKGITTPPNEDEDDNFPYYGIGERLQQKATERKNTLQWVETFDEPIKTNGKKPDHSSEEKDEDEDDNHHQQPPNSSPPTPPENLHRPPEPEVGYMSKSSIQPPVEEQPLQLTDLKCELEKSKTAPQTKNSKKKNKNRQKKIEAPPQQKEDAEIMQTVSQSVEEIKADKTKPKGVKTMNKLITTTLIIGILASVAGMTACSAKQPTDPQEEPTEQSVELEAEKPEEEATEETAEATTEVTAIELDSAEITLKIGDVMGVKATAIPEEATDKAISFTSDNDAVATVDEQGVVTAVGAGETSIVAKATNGVLSAVKVVVAQPEPVQEEVQEKANVTTQNSTPKEEQPQAQAQATAPKKSTGGVDKDGFPLNPKNNQIVTVNGKEYGYAAELDMWLEYLGENEVKVIDNSDVDMTPLY